MNNVPAPWQPVLDFWFLPPSHPDYGVSRPEWFRKDRDFDALIERQFGSVIARALDGDFREWEHDVHGALARIIVLDQFTRNTLRDTPRAFAGDPQAQQAALAMLEERRDLLLIPEQRWFVYMPLEHAEDVELQERGVALFRELEREAEFDDIADYAIRHRDIIARFGRFPHRNRILGRESTPEEIEFLKQPGSSF
jgi:uncharacterized protein (DUF924 family)